jgi:hypothetical protein
MTTSKTFTQHTAPTVFIEKLPDGSTCNQYVMVTDLNYSDDDKMGWVIASSSQPPKDLTDDRFAFLRQYRASPPQDSTGYDENEMKMWNYLGTLGKGFTVADLSPKLEAFLTSIRESYQDQSCKLKL